IAEEDEQGETIAIISPSSWKPSSPKGLYWHVAELLNVIEADGTDAALNWLDRHGYVYELPPLAEATLSLSLCRPRGLRVKFWQVLVTFCSPSRAEGLRRIVVVGLPSTGPGCLEGRIHLLIMGEGRRPARVHPSPGPPNTPVGGPVHGGSPTIRCRPGPDH